MPPSPCFTYGALEAFTVEMTVFSIGQELVWWDAFGVRLG